MKAKLIFERDGVYRRCEALLSNGMKIELEVSEDTVKQMSVSFGLTHRDNPTKEELIARNKELVDAICKAEMALAKVVNCFAPCG